MVDLSGTCTQGGSGVSGAKVYLIDADTDALMAVETSDANGDYTFPLVANGTYHVAAEYTSGGTDYNAPSQPFIDVTGSVTALEDFEGPAWPGNWEGSPSSFTTQSTTVSHGLRALTASGTNNLAGNDTDITLSNGTTYRARIYTGTDQTAGASWLWNVQNAASALADCYWMRLDTVNDRITIYERTSSSTANSYTASASGSLSPSTWYEMRWTPTATDFTAELYDGTGTTQLATTTQPNTQHRGGGVGVYASSSGAAAYWDFLYHA